MAKSYVVDIATTTLSLLCILVSLDLMPLSAPSDSIAEIVSQFDCSLRGIAASAEGTDSN